MAITNVTALAPGIEDGQDFEVEVEGVKIAFSPVGRCPGTTKNDTGHHRICHGVWWDYQHRTGYRFCPKVPDALTGLTDRLWERILGTVASDRGDQRRRAEADTEHRRRGAADDLLTFVEGIDWTVIEPAVLKNAVRKATLALKENDECHGARRAYDGE